MKMIGMCVIICLYLQYGVFCEPFIDDVHARSSRPFSLPWIPLDDADYWAERSARFAKGEIWPTLVGAPPGLYNIQVTTAWGIGPGAGPLGRFGMYRVTFYVTFPGLSDKYSCFAWIHWSPPSTFTHLDGFPMHESNNCVRFP
ncbi:uncharacterized protein LOC132747776 [Ruditapes philippinarum]|uniref:uncharacterized protein LOC132747776 n=1 Tax=Ruditapes philippinarum TaxID=129788 RepID=UPI00295A9C83|nr:uncharacterized protein LOC132747776 [Ruditapes philippinarum]